MSTNYKKQIPIHYYFINLFFVKYSIVHEFAYLYIQIDLFNYYATFVYTCTFEYLNISENVNYHKTCLYRILIVASRCIMYSMYQYIFIIIHQKANMTSVV